MEVEFASHKDEVLSEFQKKVKLALDLIGEAAESHAKSYCPVDTGRLRNSISHESIDDTAYVGTNVEYAIWVEVKDVNHTSGQAHFLRDGVAQHGDEFETIAKAVLQE